MQKDAVPPRQGLPRPSPPPPPHPATLPPPLALAMPLTYCNPVLEGECGRVVLARVSLMAWLPSRLCRPRRVLGRRAAAVLWLRHKRKRLQRPLLLQPRLLLLAAGRARCSSRPLPALDRQGRLPVLGARGPSSARGPARLPHVLFHPRLSDRGHEHRCGLQPQEPARPVRLCWRRTSGEPGALLCLAVAAVEVPP